MNLLLCVTFFAISTAHYTIDWKIPKTSEILQKDYIGFLQSVNNRALAGLATLGRLKLGEFKNSFHYFYIHWLRYVSTVS